MPTRLKLLTTLALLSACATPPPDATTATEPEIEQLPPAANDNRQLDFKLASGTYRCDLGKRVEVERDASDPHRLHIRWTGKHYQLERNLSYSGLPRYEHAGSGLVWIDLPWKSVLLDGTNNQPLASDCAPPQTAG